MVGVAVEMFSPAAKQVPTAGQEIECSKSGGAAFSVVTPFTVWINRSDPSPPPGIPPATLAQYVAVGQERLAIGPVHMKPASAVVQTPALREPTITCPKLEMPIPPQLFTVGHERRVICAAAPVSGTELHAPLL
jgi:hypothetical protein